MDNSDPEIIFNQAQGDREDLRGSPRRNARGQSEDRHHDGHDKYDRRGWYGPSRPPIVIKPDVFTGEEDWEQFISHFEDCAELGQWNAKEMLLTLAASLKGHARVFYTSLPLTEKRSFERLVSSLEQRFGSARQQARWLSKFQARVKLPKESIAAFGDDLRLMARKAYNNLEPEAQEVLALQQFYKALSVEMKCRVMDKDCRTVTEAVEVVERYEELLGDSATSGRHRDTVRQVGQVDRWCSDKVGQDNSREAGKDQVIEENEIKKALELINARLDRLEKGQKRQNQNGPRVCFNCQSPDHLYRDCPTKPKQKSNEGNWRAAEKQVSGNE
jgi:hypothetical protein